MRFQVVGICRYP